MAAVGDAHGYFTLNLGIAIVDELERELEVAVEHHTCIESEVLDARSVARNLGDTEFTVCDRDEAIPTR